MVAVTVESAGGSEKKRDRVLGGAYYWGDEAPCLGGFARTIDEMLVDYELRCSRYFARQRRRNILWHLRRSPF